MSQRSYETRPEEAPSVLAIVVTHGGREWLTDCLVGLATQTYARLDVLVVDDGSPDWRAAPPLKRVAKRHLRRRRWGFLRTPRALGFGGAINWALSRVRTDADLLLFIHDDAALSPLSVERMVARIQSDPMTAIVGPKIVSWDDPRVLEEVGMAADSFGYPYKGLDEHEIDLGQHDTSKETLYVTSTCMLVKHEVFSALKGWDARMRAFSEDLDFCWRARLAGYTVRVEPGASARHAIALATGQRSSPLVPPRYYIRRNRLRTIIKNVSGLRLLMLLPLYLLLSVAEMVGFLVLRQPSEVVNLLRALGWNFLSLPQTLSERARVQRSRKVPDERIRRFTVRETTRIRSYIGNQADRMEEAWGRRAEMIKRPGLLVAAIRARAGGWTLAALATATIGFLLGFRHFLWAAPAALGELLPFPERTTAMWRAWATAWRGAGFGAPGDSPPAFALLGLVQLFTFGAEGVAQKALILGLGAIAFFGAAWLVSDLVDKPSRLAAGLAYALGPVGYAGLRSGALGALVFGAAAPFVIGGMLRLTGWVRPPRWVPSRTVARVALGAAVSAAFVPGSLVLYALCAAVLAGARKAMGQAAPGPRPLGASLIGLFAAVPLLLPWSAGWFSGGGPFGRLWGSNWDVYAASFADHGMATVVTGRTPSAPVLIAIALPLLGLIAVFTGSGARRRTALVLWGTIAVTGALMSLTSAGWIRPIVASPTEMGVLAGAAFAGLVGLGVGAFRLDLPRRGLGRAHAATLAVVGLAAVLIAAGAVPALIRGDWAPGRGTDRENTPAVAQVRSLLGGEFEQIGLFRALWVGEGWSPPDPSAARPPRDYFVTGARGQVLTDLFERGSAEQERLFEDAVTSVRAGLTDEGGSLLAGFNIRFVVVERTEASAWMEQRDMAVSREGPSFLIFENDVPFPRAALYADIPPYLDAIEEDIRSLPPGLPKERGRQATQRSSASYLIDDAEGPGVVFLAESGHDDWTATIGGSELEPIDRKWGNAWSVPAAARGSVEVEHPRSILKLILLMIVGLAWLAVMEAALSRSGTSSFGRLRS